MFTLPVGRHALMLAMGGALAMSTTLAKAQDVEKAGEAAGVSDTKDHYVLGVGGAMVPAYQGSGDTRFRPLPVIDLAWGPLFANLRNGVGANVIDNGFVTAGASVALMQGYRRRDAPYGIGRLRPGAGARGFFTVRGGGFIATIGGTKGISGGQRGVITDVTVLYPVQFSTRLTLIPTVGATWTNKRYNNRYFGIDAVQSAASGLEQFRTGSGIKDVSGLLSLNYSLTRHINLTASGGVIRLVGDMKDSPIVEKVTNPTGFLSISYKF